MAYSITTNDGQAIPIADEQLDSGSLSLTVIGRNATNYGQSIATNTLRQLENFASNTPPGATYTPTGQLWYDKGEDTLRVYNGTVWSRVSAVPVSAQDLTLQVTTGTSYFNNTEDKLKVYDGATFRDAVIPGGTVTSAYAGNTAASGDASNYGAKVETIFLTSTEATASIIPVVAIKYVSDSNSGPQGELADSLHDSANATVMAIFSDRAFQVADTDPYHDTLRDSLSFGNGVTPSITKGLNLRKNYTDTTVAQAGTTEWADKANAIYSGATINAADIIHVGSPNWVPTGASVLGNSANSFDDLHVEQAQFGKTATAKAIGFIGNVTLGNASSLIKHVYTEDLTVTGDLNFSGVNDMGTVETATIGALTLTEGTISDVPTASTDIANKLYVDNATTSSSLVAGTVTLGGVTTASQTHYPMFADSTTGNENARVNAAFSFVPSTGVLSTVAWSGTTVTASGIVTGGTLTDGTLSINNGAITSATTGNFSGTVTANSFSGNTTGTTVTATGVVTGGTLTDGTATLSGGALTGATTGNFSGTVTANLFSGTATAARYADLAEVYATDADYAPGTVVMIGGEAEITQTLSRAETEVFGVISTDPAYLMNKDADGLPVALQGRVPVKVVGPVAKGERLISSDIPGVAVGVSEEDFAHQLQAIIGRSLENKTDEAESLVEAVIGIK